LPKRNKGHVCGFRIVWAINAHGKLENTREGNSEIEKYAFDQNALHFDNWNTVYIAKIILH
jgi:hypothetical protein